MEDWYFWLSVEMARNNKNPDGCYTDDAVYLGSLLLHLHFWHKRTNNSVSWDNWLVLPGFFGGCCLTSCFGAGKCKGYWCWVGRRNRQVDQKISLEWWQRRARAVSSEDGIFKTLNIWGPDIIFGSICWHHCHRLHLGPAILQLLGAVCLQLIAPEGALFERGFSGWFC